jgi:DNA-binding CsgD family transcriptional regulator
MSDEVSQSGQTKKARKANKRIKAAHAAALVASGKSVTEIAGTLNMSRNGVSKLLNSDETKAIIQSAESRVTLLIDKAMRVVDEEMDISPGEPNRLRAALSVLKSVGVIKEKIDMTHSFPKPTVIVKSDGTQVILGVSEEAEE